tara:strand:+ start:2468 stop:2866 length:399 start_codon:yes stop_codon:yes gene_type:complete
MGYLTESQTYNPSENDIEENVEPEMQYIMKKKKKEYYSDRVGDYIVNATTGAKYPWRVGSENENRFFRVTNTLSSTSNERKGTYDSYSSRSSRKAFYENPHEYMKHNNIVLDEEFVKEWYNRVNLLYPDGNK